MAVGFCVSPRRDTFRKINAMAKKLYKRLNRTPHEDGIACIVVVLALVAVVAWLVVC